MSRRLRACVAAALTGTVLAPAAASAQTTLAATVAIATWAAPFGGYSGCHNVGTTSVRCDHGYTSFDRATGRETCAEFGTRAVGVSTCEATLSGFTTGPGRVVGETVTVCSTTGVRTLTFAFGGASGAYPAFTVSGAVEEGDGTFAGVSDPVLLPGVGLVVQSAKGKFTFGCGGRAGSFTGSWTLTAA